MPCWQGVVLVRGRGCGTGCGRQVWDRRVSGRALGGSNGSGSGSGLYKFTCLSYTWTPKVGKNNSLLGYFWWLWAIILHTFGVQVLIESMRGRGRGRERGLILRRYLQGPPEILDEAPGTGIKPQREPSRNLRHWHADIPSERR